MNGQTPFSIKRLDICTLLIGCIPGEQQYFMTKSNEIVDIL